MQQQLFDLPEKRHHKHHKPENNTLYVIAVMFNPRGWKSRVKLYKEFAEYVGQYPDAKLLTVEAAFVDRPHECTVGDNPWHVQLRTDCELWHKERMVNIGLHHLHRLAPDAKYVAWIDADVRFSRPDWVQATIKALHHYAIVQMYSEAHNLNPNHESQWKATSIFKQWEQRGFHQHPPIPIGYGSTGHPGLAWAGRVDLLNQLGGLIDFCIAGSGDTHMANALRGDITLAFKKGMSAGFKRALERWATRATAIVKMNIGYVPGICMHYWHGKSEHRGYEKRWDIMNFHQFDPNEDIYIEGSGLYRFTGNKLHLEYDLRLSSSKRNEDGTDE